MSALGETVSAVAEQIAKHPELFEALAKALRGGTPADVLRERLFDAIRADSDTRFAAALAARETTDDLNR